MFIQAVKLAQEKQVQDTEIRTIETTKSTMDVDRMTEDREPSEEDTEATDKETLLATDHRTRGLSHTRVRSLLLKGSLFVCGLALLVAGGVGSIFRPYVSEEEYSNCTNLFTKNFSMSF